MKHTEVIHCTFILVEVRVSEINTFCHLVSDLFEVAILALFPVHHVVEDGDHDVPDLTLRHQGHAQEGSNHSWDKVDLIFTWRKNKQKIYKKNNAKSIIIT